MEFRADKRVVSEKGAWNAPLTPKTFKKGMTGPNLKRGLDVPLSPRFLSREQGSNQGQGTMAKTSVAILTLALLAFGGFASPKQEAPQKLPSNPLERQVPYYTVELLPTRVAFQAAPGPARAPGGVASVFDCEQDAPRQVFRGMGQKIGDVMEQLVSADPRYRWEMDDGVINLLPAAGEPALVKRRIPPIDAEDIPSARAVLGKIEQLPEVRKARAELNLTWGLTCCTQLMSLHPKTFAVHFKGGSVREALNTFARVDGSSIWD